MDSLGGSGEIDYVKKIQNAWYGLSQESMKAKSCPEP